MLLPQGMYEEFHIDSCFLVHITFRLLIYNILWHPHNSSFHFLKIHKCKALLFLRIEMDKHLKSKQNNHLQTNRKYQIMLIVYLLVSNVRAMNRTKMFYLCNLYSRFDTDRLLSVAQKEQCSCLLGGTNHQENCRRLSCILHFDYKVPCIDSMI